MIGELTAYPNQSTILFALLVSTRGAQVWIFGPNSCVAKLPIFEELITYVSAIAASTLEAADGWSILLEKNINKREDEMQEPIDPLNTQSRSGEKAQTDEPVVSRQETPGELRNGGAENDATDNAPTVSEREVQSHLSNETGSMAKSADAPAANFAQDETPLETVCTPLVELTRPESGGPINIATISKGGSPAQVALKRSNRIPAMPPSFHKSLVLPSKPEAFGSARELFDSILALLQKHVQLSKKECSILAYWSIATWFVDYLPFLPPVVITGTASAADLLLRTLVAVCRRPVLLADVNPAVVRSLPLADLKPTLLIREPQLSKRTAALLDASSHPGYLVCGSKDFQQVYCAKCIYVGELAKDQLFTSNSIHIHVGENSLGALYAPRQRVP